MTEKHYDVVVLGRSLGALVAAALLARRDFRVLVIGQGARPPSYAFERHVFRRSAFTLLAASSPVFRRVLAELAQTQAFRRRAQPLDPMLGLVLPAQRMELPPDPELFARELEREMKEAQRPIEDFHAALASLHEAADTAFKRDATWPPGTFWERRETGRLASALPYLRGEGVTELPLDLPPFHPFRAVVRALARFGSDLASELPAFARGRLYGSFLRGTLAFARGQDEIEEILLDRIVAHGGALRLQDRVSQIGLRSGLVANVSVEGDLSPTGATFVVSDQTGAELAELTGGEGISARTQREWSRLERAAGRFVMSIVVRSAGLPQALGREVLLLPSLDERVPPLFLVRLDPARMPEAPPEAALESLLVVELLLPLTKPGPVALGEAREYVLQTLSQSFPFLERHLVVADSPHDGRPVWKWEEGRRVDIDRFHLTGGSARAEPMQPQFTMASPGWLGLAGEPVRGPIPRTFLAGGSVLPALGQEGQLLAAWSAARIITRADRHKERIRKAMWSRVEIG